MVGSAPRTYWVDDPIDNFRVRVTLFHDAPPRAEPRDARLNPSRASATEKDALLPEDRRSRRAQRNRDGAGPSEAEELAPLPEATVGISIPAAGDDPSAELGTRGNPHVRDFSWQQKVIGPSEVRKYRRKRAPRTSIETLGVGLSMVSQLFVRSDAEAGFRDSSYADQIAKLDDEAKQRFDKPFEGEVLHSKVHVDRFIDIRELHTGVTTNRHEKPSPLATFVLSGKAFDGAQAGKEATPDGGLVVKPPPSQVMHIVAELTDDAIAAKLGAKPGAEEEYSSDEENLEKGPGKNLFVLCTVRAYANGRLDMTPGFSDEGVEVEEIEELRAGNVLANGQPLPGDDSNDSAAQWYRLKHARSTRVWRFRIENLAERKVDEAERRAERAARMQELIARKNLGGVDFTPSPPAGGLVAHLFSELVGTHGFPAADLLVQYFVHVNEGWRAGAETQLHGMSQTCSPKWVAGDHAGEYAAHFGHPFELSMWKDPSTVRAPGGSVSDGSEAGVGGVQRQAGGAGLSASGLGSVSMGTLFVQVMSRTRFNRFMVEGYGYIPLLPEAGMQTHRVATWRPLSTVSSSIRRFFVSEGDEVSDLRYLCVPSGAPSRGLNKYGFSSESAGTVVVRINCITQGAPKPPARSKQATAARAAAAGGGGATAAGGTAEGEGGLTKAERVREKLAAKQRERELAATARSTRTSPLAVRRRSAGAGGEASQSLPAPREDPAEVQPLL